MRDDEAVRALVSRLGVVLAGDPAPTTPTPREAESLEAVWARLEGVSATAGASAAPAVGAAATAAMGAAGHRRSTRAVRQRLLGGLAAAAALAVIAVVVMRPAPAVAMAPVLTFSGVGHHELSPSSGAPADRTLAALAAAARATPAPAATAGATQHVVAERWRLEVTVQAHGEVSLAVHPARTESWLTPGGQLRQRETPTGATFSPDGRLSPQAVPVGEVLDDTAASPRSPGYAADLPTDSTALAATWLRDLDPSVPDAPTAATVLAHRLIDLYDAWVAPPATNAAAWEALLATGEVRDLGTVTDRAGRPGQAVSIWDASTTTLIILIADPASGALLSHEDVIFDYPGVESDHHLPGPQVASFACYLTSEWVR